jgi:urate oxidase
MKNSVYILAKQNSVIPPELFASIIGSHFIETYKHIHAATVYIEVFPWTRMVVGGNLHPHSFASDSTGTRKVEARIEEGTNIVLKSQISGLLVLKSTGSEFHDYIKDEYTTLKEVWDRVLSTEVDCSWTWTRFATLEAVKSAIPKFDEAFESAMSITRTTFAEENSNSVQDTVYKMARLILGAVELVERVDYSLPNKHYFEIGELGRDYLGVNGTNGEQI